MAASRQRQTGDRVRLYVFVTPEQRKRYAAEAEAEGLSLSAYIGAALEERSRRRPVFRIAEYRALIEVRRQLQITGRNINDMLRRLHIWANDPRAKKAPDADLVERSASELRDLRQRIDAILKASRL